MVRRREFLSALAVGAAGLAVGATAKSYGQILGSNDRLNFAVIGLNGRGYAHLSALKANRSAARISHVCDVDSNILKKFAGSVQQEMGEAPVSEKDFRRILEQKDVDAITIATPDHWHAPMAIAGLKAGKHVFLEKPCSHNPAEGEMLVQAQQKYRKLVQMGTQQRSSQHTTEIIEKISQGIVGRAYFAKAWYSNVRKSIGTGKEAPVPPLAFLRCRGPRDFGYRPGSQGRDIERHILDLLAAHCPGYAAHERERARRSLSALIRLKLSRKIQR
jgi:hypothetical protein